MRRPSGGGGGAAAEEETEEESEEEWDEAEKVSYTYIRRPGAWSREEDAALQKLVDKHGAKNWELISKGIAGRSASSCRVRWFYPTTRVERPFTAAEDATIIKAHAQHGSKWGSIAGLLPGRSDSAIKNHWMSKLQRRLERRRSVAAAAAERYHSTAPEGIETNSPGGAVGSNAPRLTPCPGSSSKPSSSGRTLKDQILNCLADPSFPAYVNEVEKIWREIESESLHHVG